MGNKGKVSLYFSSFKNMMCYGNWVAGKRARMVSMCAEAYLRMAFFFVLYYLALGLEGFFFSFFFILGSSQRVKTGGGMPY